MRKNQFYPVLIIIILGLAYGLTLAPGLSWANNGVDGGDLISAAAVNGVPHPTGYPLYMLIAKLFQMLPFGSLAFRTNLLSALCTILAALLVYQTIYFLKKENKYGSISAAAGALMFGLAPLVWSQAVITEVYGLQSLLTIGVLYQTIRFGNKYNEDFLRGLLLGFALGNQITAIFLFPFLFFDKEKFRITLDTHLLIRALGLIVGTSVYLILPLRAAHNPPINWLNPVTFNSFFQLISGSIYQSYFSTSFVLEHARAWAGLLIANLSIPGVVIGIYSLLGSDKKIFKLQIAWIFLAYGLFALFYASYDSYVYLIQTLLAFSLWVGLGIDELVRIIHERWRNSIAILSAVIILFLVFRIISTMPEVNAAKDDRAEAFGQSLLAEAPENALIFMEDDYSTFALWYFRFALEKRTDIKVISEGLTGFGWYRQTLRSTYPTLKIPEIPDLAHFQLIAQNPGLPYCFIEYTDSAVINCFPSNT